MNDLRPRHAKHNSDHIESVNVSGAVKTTHPVPRCLYELPLFPPMNCSQRPPIFGRHAGLHFHERYRSIAPFALCPLRHQVDVTVTAPEPSIQNTTAFLLEKLLGDSFAAFSEYLSCEQHALTLAVTVTIEASFPDAKKRNSAPLTILVP